MTSDDLVFMEAERAELFNRAEHYRKQAESARKHADALQTVHKRHVQTLETSIREIADKLEYQTRRADANWKALCECRGEEP